MSTSNTSEDLNQFALKLRDHWISVKEKLPPEGFKVLTFDEVNLEWRIDYLIYCDDDKKEYFWGCMKMSDYDQVSHWMRLPLPPHVEMTPRIMHDDWVTRAFQQQKDFSLSGD